MAIRPSDISKLWGRAGGRCSICGTSLTPLTIEGTLGEVAHIVARAEAGPRGASDLGREARDRYENLILLCPTHHAEVDRDVDGWPTERLKETKHSHEKFIQEQFDRGVARPRGDQLERFLEERKSRWAERADHSWLVCGLSPLDLDEAAFNPTAEEVVRAVRALRLPDQLSFPLGGSPNPYYIETFEHGLVFEDFRRLGEGVGYRLELHRTGYAELAVCLDEVLSRPARQGWPDDRASQMALQRGGNRLDPGLHPLEYEAWSELMTWAVQTLLALWRGLGLPFEDAISTTLTLAPPGTYLFVSGFGLPPVAGRATTTREVAYNRLVSESEEPAEVTLEILGRLVAHFGLVLQLMEWQGSQVPVPGRLRVT